MKIIIKDVGCDFVNEIWFVLFLKLFFFIDFKSINEYCSYEEILIKNFKSVLKVVFLYLNCVECIYVVLCVYCYFFIYLWLEFVNICICVYCIMFCD